MHASYKDILDLTTRPPLWFDEAGVPRFTPFKPQHIANIYAQEAVLMEIACQACGHRFHVAMSSPAHEQLANQITSKMIGYGDPPNAGCCNEGPTMTSDSKQIIEYWSKHAGVWQRNTNLEISISG